MKISVLAENTLCISNSENLESENGLSLFIEFGNRKILFDTGQSAVFIHNALKLGIDLAEVDILVISHGHFDHGGGLKHFLKINKKAKVFLHRYASERFYTMIFGFLPFYVGLNQKMLLRNTDRISFVGNDMEIGDKILLLEGFNEIFPQPEANKTLFHKINGKLMPDKFRHELAMMLHDKDGPVLFTGCSHSGIINIIRKAKHFSANNRIKATFGGFHIHNSFTKRNESQEYIEELSKALGETDTIFYTGHCTGENNFRLIKGWMCRRIKTMKTGEMIEV